MISPKEFARHSINQINTWYTNFTKKDYDVCNEISNKQISLSRKILKDKIFADAEEENNLAYITGVLFSAYNEYILLAKLTRDVDWPTIPKKTEEIWLLMCNCKDRLDFCRRTLISCDYDWQLKSLAELKNNFIENFGHGIYSSPEILIEKEVCSICKLDTRACMHFPGRLYNGVMCNITPIDFELKTVSLVTIPRDPRCRMWNWNMNSDNIISGAILTLFRIDDWLEKED